MSDAARLEALLMIERAFGRGADRLVACALSAELGLDAEALLGSFEAWKADLATVDACEDAAHAVVATITSPDSGRALLRREVDRTSRTDVAERLGVACSTISRWYNGRVEPDLDGRRALARELGIPIDISW